MKIGVIGAGPSGLFAALEARKRHDSVCLLDANLAPGRKLAASGAGRGNLTNINVSPEKYFAVENFGFSNIIQKNDYHFLIRYFEDIGIYTYHTEDGWVYPLSNSAKNIANLLAIVALDGKIEIRSSSKVVDIHHQDRKFNVLLENGQKFDFDRLIIATGGRAHPQLKAFDNLLSVLSRLGHPILPVFPALSPIQTTKDHSKLLNGVRLDANCILRTDDQVIASSTGNIIFTEWGINGPGVMDISHFVTLSKKPLQVEVNFFFGQSQSNITRAIANSSNNHVDLHEALLSIFPKKLLDQFDHNAKINHLNFLQFQKSNMDLLPPLLSFTEKTKGARGFEFCQLSTGGISSSSVDTSTLESNVIPGLFFAGEILDVMGPCGGYNLHWAFVSGITAGRNI